MKKFLRLVLLCLLPGLMFVFFNAALAGSPDPKNQVDQLTGQIDGGPRADRAPISRSALQSGPITGLSISYSSPGFAGLPVRLAAVISGGARPIYYAWSFGDGTVLPPDAGAVVSHTYALTGTYSVVVTAFNVMGPVSQTISLAVIDPPYKLYLPTISKEFTQPTEPADLICSLSLYPPNPVASQPVLITVQIQNQSGSADGFWVDLYVNPSTIPSPDNLLRWQDACGGLSSCSRGIAWSISNDPLRPGITRTLVSVPHNFHPDGFDLADSVWTGSLPAGTYDLYAYADSINNPELENTNGAVLETNEGNNRCEILDLVVPTASIVGLDERPSSQLPARPTP